MVVCTPTKKAYIWRQRQKYGKKFNDIAEDLKIDRSVVSRNYRKMEKEGPNPNFYAKAKKPGRPRKISCHGERQAERLIKSSRASDATDVKRKIFPNASACTVCRMFTRIGMHGRIRWKKPFLKKEHIAARLAWAREWARRREYYWRKVWYTDESKFNLFGSDGKLYCRRRVGEALLPRNVKKVVKHGGGSVQVWGCVSYNGTGRLHRVQGKMDAVQYTAILEESLLGSFTDRRVKPRNIVVQQDNDPKHTSKRAKTWFRENNITLLPWPACSPDQNIIEHCWDYVDDRVREREVKPANLEELWEALQEEWAKIPLSYIRHLYKSIPRRINGIIENKGSWTKY